MGLAAYLGVDFLDVFRRETMKELLYSFLF